MVTILTHGRSGQFVNWWSIVVKVLFLERVFLSECLHVGCRRVIPNWFEFTPVWKD